MTYKELKKLVKKADKVDRVPSEKALRESDAVVVVQKKIDGTDGIISVYDNGYVSYVLGRKKTVFPLHGCKNLCYQWVLGKDSIYEDSLWDNEPWYIRLVIEGDERITKSMENCDTGKLISYSAIAEDYKDMADPKTDVSKNIIEKEQYEELCSLVGKATKKQAEAIIRYYIDEESYTELSAEMGITRQSGAELVVRGIERIRRFVSNSRK